MNYIVNYQSSELLNWLKGNIEDGNWCIFYSSLLKTYVLNIEKKEDIIAFSLAFEEDDIIFRFN